MIVYFNYLKRILFLIFILLNIIFLNFVYASNYPRIGLALSGGGARGAAHIGVLKVIEELRIPINFIAGTSMGAIIGGLYAMGMTPIEIENAIAEINWNEIFKDDPPRVQRRIRRKLDDQTFLIAGKPGVQEKKREINLVPALIQGQKLDLALRRYSLPASNINDFNNLRIPFRAVATDVVTGEAVLLSNGDLATALRASMAVPAVFAPVEYDGKLLVDGGLALNLPIQKVHEMGADCIIAVDVSGPRRTREEIRDVLEMLDQVSSLITWRNTQAEIVTLGPCDLLITPPLEHHVLASDFNKMKQAIMIGEQAAQVQKKALEKFSLSSTKYITYLKQHSLLKYQNIVINKIIIENDSRLSNLLLNERLTTKPGQLFKPLELEQQITKIYDQDNFASVRYHLNENQILGSTLIINAQEKPWGTSFLQGGLELSSTTGGDSQFNTGLSYTMLPLNSLNGEWRTLVRMGEEPALLSEIYQPLDLNESWYVNIRGGYLTDKLVLFNLNAFSKPIAEYQLKRIGGKLEFGRNLDTWGRVGLGYNLYYGDAEMRIGSPLFNDYNFTLGELYAHFYIDTLDNLNFPHDGWLNEIFIRTSRQAFGASDNYNLEGFNLFHASNWNKDSLLTGITFAGNFGQTTPPQALYRLGGFLNLSGFNQNELSGTNVGLLRAVYLHSLNTSLIKTYFGISLESGNVWQQYNEINFSNLHFASSIFIGADTFIGPLYFAYGYADGGNSALYLLLGCPWSSHFSIY